MGDSSVEVVLIYIDILDKMSLTAPALVLIHDEVRTRKGSKEAREVASLSLSRC